TVAAGQTGNLVFDHAGGDNSGLLLTSVKLTNTSTSTVLLDDNFDLPFPDGNFLLQIVPVITSLDITSLSVDGRRANVTRGGVGGRGLTEGRNSVDRFGSQSVIDSSNGTGPDVGGSNTTVSLTVGLNGAFGVVKVQTEGGTSAAYSVGYTGLVATAVSGTAAN